MVKPAIFQQPYVTARNMPYVYTDESVSNQFALEGVLCSGQIVWIGEADTSRARPRSAVGFVDGIGIVVVDPRWLTRAQAPVTQSTPQRAADKKTETAAKFVHNPAA